MLDHPVFLFYPFLLKTVRHRLHICFTVMFGCLCVGGGGGVGGVGGVQIT